MRNISISILAVGSLILYPIDKTWSQDQETYIKSLNSKIPGTPEATNIMKYVDFPVTLFTGQPDINLPLCEVKGKALSMPINLSYNATNGINVNDLAGKSGLGWLLKAGGEITRDTRGGPDEGTSGVAGLLDNLHPFSFYELDIQNNPNGTYAHQAAAGQLDLEPDLFYFSMAGQSGKFIYDVDNNVYVCTQLEPYRVYYDKPNDAWTIIDPDGNYYLFDKKVGTSRQQYCSMTTPITNAPTITTSWKLSKMVNADRTDTISIEYSLNSYYYFSEGASIVYQAGSSALTTNRPNMNCFNKNSIFGYEEIQKIYSVRDTVIFQYASAEREDIGQQQHALEYIKYSNGDPNAQMIFKMSYGYYNRSQVVGDNPTIQGDFHNKKSLRLDQLTNFGNSESNAYPLKWNFTYNGTALPARLSYAQDFWGYPNQNTEGNTLAPMDVLYYAGGGSTYVGGADRYPSPSLTGAGVLQSIKFPTGGTTTFEYEPNTTSEPTPMARPADMISVSNHIIQGDAPPAAPYGYQTLNFTVDVPDNPEANLEDGVVANIAISPTTPTGGGAVNGYPYFMLGKIHDLSGVTNNGPSFSQTFLFNGVTNNVFLPNGIYQMTVIPNGFNGPTNNNGNDGSASTLGLTFSVNYHIPDPNAPINYVLGGLRIKSITSKDQFSNITSTKNYSYNNPDDGKSYGVFIGSTMRQSNDYLTKVETLPGGGQSDCATYNFLARHGNCISPGSTSLGAAVIYPTVTEFTNDGSKSYKTEYHYSYIQPYYGIGFPFCPPVLNESAHGKLLSSTAFQDRGNNLYWNAQTQKNVYNFSPGEFNNPGNSVGRNVRGFRSAYLGYTDDPMVCNFDIAVSNEYSVFVNRADLTSDSIITYDMGNQSFGVNEWHDYVYGDHSQKPIVTRAGSSDGSIVTRKVWYPADKPEANTNINFTPVTSFASQLSVANRLNQPLGMRDYKGNQLLKEQYTYGHISSSQLLVDSIKQAILGNNLETEIRILAYDNNANPTKVLMKGNRYRKYIWQSGKALPLATATMPGDNFFYFNSFEYGDGTPGNSFSGSNAHQLSVSPLNFITAVINLEVYVWATSDAFTINGGAPQNTGKTKGIWTLYKKNVTSNNGWSIEGNALIDQVVMLPQGTQFQGVVYDKSNRVIAVVNDQMSTSFYEYDNFGRLQTVRDEKGNILNSTAYQYQGAQ